MIDEKQIALAGYRVEQAEETLVAAKICFQNIFMSIGYFY